MLVEETERREEKIQSTIQSRGETILEGVESANVCASRSFGSEGGYDPSVFGSGADYSAATRSNRAFVIAISTKRIEECLLIINLITRVGNMNS